MYPGTWSFDFCSNPCTRVHEALRIFIFFPLKGIWFPAKPKLSFDLIYNLEAVASCPMIFMGLALVHFQKCWLLRTMLCDIKCFDAMFKKPSSFKTWSRLLLWAEFLKNSTAVWYLLWKMFWESKMVLFIWLIKTQHPYIFFIVFQVLRSKFCQWNS